MKKIKRLITSALPYINNVPHLGHLAGSHLPADIFARFSRAQGYETLFVGGSDEHGTPSELAARRLGIETGKFCSVLHEEHQKIYKWFGISYDNYTRTETKVHHEMTQDIFREIQQNGFVHSHQIKMYYDAQQKIFLPDRYVVGTCHACGYDEANGDQCEQCAKIIKTQELINPRSTLTGEVPQLRETEHLFLDLEKLSLRLEQWLKANKQLKPAVRNVAMAWLREGLHERGITRDLQYGVPVPLTGFEKKVFYVWFDAPIAYISAVRELLPTSWEDFWQDENAEIIHFLGKDNIPFHTIFWPAILLADGRYNLPTQVVGMQYLNYEGAKFSKSKKLGVFCEKFPESGMPADIMRAYLCFILPENHDAEFSWDDFMVRINNELIANLGNFVHRACSFTFTKVGELPEITLIDLQVLEQEMLAKIKTKIITIQNLMTNYQLRQAFLEILALSALGNKYFNDRAPWQIIKTDRVEAGQVLFVCTYLCAVLAVLICPYLPFTATKIWQQLALVGVPDEVGIYERIVNLDLIPNYHQILAPQVLFEKITDDTLLHYRETLSAVRAIEEFF